MLSMVSMSAAKKPPHLLFVLVDDMGYNDFYSSTDISGAWSNVQTLADERCIKVEHYYTQPICTPTRGALMSGRYPVRLGLQHGVIGGSQDYGLPLDEVTLADKLNAAGYNTVGIGKWHLGAYNNASIPSRRGFNHWFGYYNGAEDYFTHQVGGYLDLFDDEVPRFDFNNTYGTSIFLDQAVMRIREHSAKHADKPLFMYLPFQNVHAPLEARESDLAKEPCASISDTDRKTFCAMALAADEAIGNITQLMDSEFPEDDVIVVISGDNGGAPPSAGNNCPEYGQDKLCLRGAKGSLYEGGVRNNALLCSKTQVPDAMKGKVYSKGLVHVTDWHAMLVELGGASHGSKAIDGKNVFSAITKNTESPRVEILHNLDTANGRDVAYRFNGCVGKSCGDWKFFHVLNPLGWTPPKDGPQCEAQGPRGSCGAPSDFDGSGTPEAYSYPNDDYGIQLYDLSTDPNEEKNLASSYHEVVVELRARVSAIEESDDFLEACNVDGGSCYDSDPDADTLHEACGAWLPWVADSIIV